MGKLLSGLRDQMSTVAQERVDNERRQVAKQRHQIRNLIHSGAVFPPGYVNQSICQPYYRAMLRIARLCHSMSSVCLSVRLSVRNV